MSNAIDLVGQRFDHLVVLSLDHTEQKKNNHSARFWKCKCDCGNEKVLRYDLLKYRPHRSCGHTRCHHKSHPKGKKSNIWRGCGDISAAYYRNLQSNAKTRNFDFGVDVTLEYLWKLFEKQDKKCALTGMGLSFNVADSTNDGTASLDRIDANIGYVRENVQWVHKDINRMKQHYPESYFVEMCSGVADYNGQKNKI